MMNCADKKLIKLWRKNRDVVRKSCLVPAEMVIVLVIFLSNFSLDTKNKIGCIDEGVYMAVAYYLMPLFLIILFFKIYWEEFSSGYVMIDLLSGYSRSEMICIKLLTGAGYSILILFLPFALNYIIFCIISFSAGPFLQFISLESLGTALSALINYSFYSVFLNTLFLIVFLALKLKPGLKYILWIMEAGLFFFVHIRFAGRTILSVEYLLFAVITAFNMAVLIRLFKAVDL